MIFQKWIFPIFGCIGISIGLYEAVKLAWVCDDAFISFVYAKNLSSGNGLVFNFGERVEGFSNLLWTLVLSAFSFVGLSLPISSVSLGILSYLALMLFFLRQESRLLREFPLPIFVLHLCFFYHGWIFASSGLETMAYTLAVSIGLYGFWKQTSSESELSSPKFSHGTHIAFVIASFLRPDGILFLSVFMGYRLFQKKFKDLYYLIPIIFLFSFRILYFQSLLPNTYYAKVHSESYLSQGVWYLLYLFRAYPLYTLVFGFSLIRLVFWICQFSKQFFFAVSLVLYILYVLYIGGDFMALRFWMPIFPILSWICYTEYLRIISVYMQGHAYQTGFANFLYSMRAYLLFLFLVSSAIYSNPIVETKPFWHEIGEERMFYGKGLLSDDGYDSQSMTGMRVAFFGAQAHFVYYFEPSYAWEAETGLTDKALASRSKKKEGRVGHQNLGDLQTIREKKIHLVMDNRYPEANLPKIEYKFRENILRFYVNLYDPKLFDSLCQRTLWNCASLYDRMQRESLLPGREHQF